MIAECIQHNKGIGTGALSIPYLTSNILGPNVGFQMRPYNSYFEDDEVVIAEDKQGLNYIARKLNEEYTLAGLTINVKMCEK